LQQSIIIPLQASLRRSAQRLAGLLTTVRNATLLIMVSSAMVAGVAHDQRACGLMPCQLRVLHVL
jgi:hypothetical protein